MEKGKVLLTRDDKLLLLCKNRYFIAKGEAKVGDDVDFEASVPLVGRNIALEDLVPLGTKEFARNPLAPQTVTDAQISIVTQQWHCAAP